MAKSVFGKDFDEKKSLFMNDLSIIEEKYSNLLQDIISIDGKTEKDVLSNHYRFEFGNDNTEFGFRKDSYLPSIVEQEAMTAFSKYFRH